jgi:16S rRNA G966 N2-methylase RsmD
VKTILLEVEEQSYQTILNFIKLLPENQCRVIDDDELSGEEQLQVQKVMAQIQQGDYSEFEAWEVVKVRL